MAALINTRTEVREGAKSCVLVGWSVARGRVGIVPVVHSDS
jgi:hypothetical protein